MLNIEVAICDSEEESKSGENVEDNLSVDVEKDSNIGDQAILEQQISEQTPSLPLHTIQINAAPGSAFPQSGLRVVIPPEIAAQLAKGGFNLMLEPIQSAVEGEPARFAMKAVPIEQCEEIPSPKKSGNDSEGESHNSDTEDDTPIRKQQKKGLGSAHKGGTVRKYCL